MTRTEVSALFLSCLALFPSLSVAQSRQAGLWTVTEKTTILHSQDRGTASAPQGAEDNSSNQSVSLPVCLSQDLISHYGVILPPSLRECTLSHVIQSDTRYSADMTCHGTYNGRGSVDETYADPTHLSGKLTFVAKTPGSDKPFSIRWVREVSAEFKSADCGKVKPRPIPAALPAK